MLFYSFNAVFSAPEKGWRCVRDRPLEAPTMTARPWFAVLLTLAVLCGGCSANFKFNDNSYRPLGDPQAVNRGK